VQELTEKVAGELSQDMADVRKALAGKDADEARKTTQAALTRYAKTKAKPWFADASACATLMQTHLKLEEQMSSGKKVSPAAVDQAVKGQQQLAGLLVTPEWKPLAADRIKQTLALATGSKDGAK